MKIIVSASPVLCPPREAITWKSPYAKQLAKIDSCDRIIYSNIARCNTNVTSCALFGSIYGDFYLQGMPLAISFIVHQFHNRPIEGLLHQFMSIMESWYLLSTKFEKIWQKRPTLDRQTRHWSQRHSATIGLVCGWSVDLGRVTVPQGARLCGWDYQHLRNRERMTVGGGR